MTNKKHHLSIRDVDNHIIAAIEETRTPDKMGPQSSLWNKVYEALEDLRRLEKERNNNE